MNDSESSFGPGLDAQMRDLIAAAIPGAEVTVRAMGGGHFEIDAVSPAFEGLAIVARHRKVLGAIAHLMAGDHAPVHAIDRLSARTP
jgi:acid stress-induced BolA-like protein IbaG/YrbA